MFAGAVLMYFAAQQNHHLLVSDSFHKLLAYSIDLYADPIALTKQHCLLLTYRMLNAFSTRIRVWGTIGWISPPASPVIPAANVRL